jgi:hypothetical protein
MTDQYILYFCTLNENLLLMFNFFVRNGKNSWKLNPRELFCS